MLGRSIENIGTSALIRRILFAILVASLALGVGGFYVVMRQRALEAASNEARVMLSTAMSVSAFT